MLHDLKDFFSTLFYVGTISGVIIGAFLSYPTILVIIFCSFLMVGVVFCHAMKQKEPTTERNNLPTTDKNTKPDKKSTIEFIADFLSELKEKDEKGTKSADPDKPDDIKS